MISITVATICAQMTIASGIMGVDSSLVDKIIQVESSYNANVIGDDGKSIGLMQIQLPTARDLGFSGSKKDLLDASTNLNLGIKYVKLLLKRYNGDINLTLLAYNSGMSIADKYKNKKVLSSKYVNKVLDKRPMCI